MISSASEQFFHLTVPENIDNLPFHLNYLYSDGFSKRSSNVLNDQKSDNRFFFLFFMFCFVFFFRLLLECIMKS